MVVDKSNLIILTKNENTLKTYQIDFSSELSVSLLASQSLKDTKVIKPFTDVSHTKKYFQLYHNETGLTQFVNP
jgi:hypothetical protein